MAIPVITALKLWAGTLFTKDDWDFNFSQIVSWLGDGTSDLVVNTIKTTNGIDLDGANIINVGAATSGDQAVNLDQAQTLLNRSSYYYPFSVASGKVDSNGDAAYLQKDSETQVTVLAGNVNPDLVCVSSDATIETVTSNTILTVPNSDGTYHIIKEKEQPITITAGASGKVTVGKTFPAIPNIGDYYCDNSTVPFKGYKYTTSGWTETPFCWLGDVTVSSGVATIKQYQYNDNRYDLNVYNAGSWVVSDSGVIFNSTSKGSYTLDLSSYLPDDNNVYEVLFNIYAGSSSNTVSKLLFKTVVNSTVNDFIVMAQKHGDSSNGGYVSNAATIPVLNRTISLEIADAAFNTMELRAIAYKKSR